jgi:hypothetical protein
MPFPFDPSPSTLWTLHRDEKTAAAEVRFVPAGVEIRVLRNGKRLFSRIFDNGDDALKEAEEERTRMIAQGWSLPL